MNYSKRNWLFCRYYCAVDFHKSQTPFQSTTGSIMHYLLPSIQCSITINHLRYTVTSRWPIATYPIHWTSREQKFTRPPQTTPNPG